MSVEKTFTPGAVTLGFNAPSSVRGPADVNAAASRNVASGTFAAATPAVVGCGCAKKVGVSLNCSSMKGIVGLVSNGLKKPAALFTTPIADAPAAVAFEVFVSKVHVPRDTMTTAPATPPAG